MKPGRIAMPTIAIQARAGPVICESCSIQVWAATRENSIQANPAAIASANLRRTGM